MRPYIYGDRSGVHIIDLGQTKQLADAALAFIKSVVASGERVLFVGTKTQARQIIREQAERVGMHYVNNRWMGGTLTNFNTIKKSIDRLIDLQTRRQNEDFKGYTKKELLDVDRTVVKLEASLGGIKSLDRTPGAVFVVDPTHERIAVREARKLGIPIVAMVDTNCDPDPIDYIIPSNDDALGAIIYFVNKITEACQEGLQDGEKIAQHRGQQADAGRGHPKRRRVTKGETSGKKAAFVDRSSKDQAAEQGTTDSYSVKLEETNDAPATQEEGTHVRAAAG